MTLRNKRCEFALGFIPFMLLAFVLFAATLNCAGGDDSDGHGSFADNSDDDLMPADDDAGSDDDDWMPDDDNDDDNDDDSDDDFWPDDDDADDDDDDDNGNSIKLFFFPDPEDSTELFFPGAAFAMEVKMYDQYGAYMGSPTDYDLDIEPDVFGAVEYDSAEGSIFFNRAETYTIAAVYPAASRMRSNEIEVTITDLEDAEIEIYTPERGLFSEQNTVYVSGRCLVEGEACAQLLAGGESPDEYDTDTGEFGIDRHLRSGLNIITVKAYNEGGYQIGNEHISVLYGETHDDEFCNDSVGVRVTNAGMNSIGDIAQQIIQEMDVQDLLDDFGTQDILDLGCFGGTAELTVTDIAFGAPEIAFNMVGEELQLIVVLPDVHVGVDLGGLIPVVSCFDDDLTWGDSGYIEADIEVSAAVIVGVTPQEKLSVDIVNMTTTVDNLDIQNLLGIVGDILGFLDDVLFNAMSSLVSGFIELIGPSLLQEPLEEALAEQLNELDLSTDFELLDHNYYLEAVFTHADIDSQGLFIRMKAKMSAESYDPSMPNPGSYYKPGDMPDMDEQYIPGTSRPYNMGIALNDDILNQALYAIFRSGVLNMEFEDDSILNTQILGIFFPGLWQIHPDAPVIIRLRPLLQPVIYMGDTGSLRTKIQLGEFMLDFVVDHPDDGEILAFTAALAMDLPAEIDIDGQGRITLNFDEDAIDVEMSILDTDYDFSDSFVEGFVPTLVELVVPLLGNLLGAIEIPTFEGYTIQVDALKIIGDANDFIGVYGDVAQEGL